MPIAALVTAYLDAYRQAEEAGRKLVEALADLLRPVVPDLPGTTRVV